MLKFYLHKTNLKCTKLMQLLLSESKEALDDAYLYHLRFKAAVVWRSYLYFMQFILLTKQKNKNK